MTAVKKFKADVNDPIFKKIDTGLYEAKLFGYTVHFDRVATTIWEARVVEGEEAGKLLAVSENRSKAMREAFDNLMRAERKRLDWVLSGDPMRTYGKRGQYKTDVKIDRNTSQKDRDADKRKEEAKAYIENIVKGNQQPELKLVEKVKPAVENTDEDDEENDAAKIPRNLMDGLTTEQRLRLSKLYKIRKNKMTGMFAVAGYNLDGGFNRILGEFPTAGDAYTYMLKCEGILKD